MNQTSMKQAELYERTETKHYETYKHYGLKKHYEATNDKFKLGEATSTDLSLAKAKFPTKRLIVNPIPVKMETA